MYKRETCKTLVCKRKTNRTYYIQEKQTKRNETTPTTQTHKT